MSVTIDQDSLFTKALLYSMNAHHGQYRHYSKQQYIYHPVRVSEYVYEHFSHRDDAETLRSVALLHDLIEDTWVGYEDLVTHFNTEIADLVDALSHDKALPKPKRMQKYRAALRDAPEGAHIVKLADIWDNTHDVMEDNPERYKRYLKKSLKTLEILDANDEAFKAQKKRLLGIIHDKL